MIFTKKSSKMKRKSNWLKEKYKHSLKDSVPSVMLLSRSMKRGKSLTEPFQRQNKLSWRFSSPLKLYSMFLRRKTLNSPRRSSMSPPERLREWSINSLQRRRVIIPQESSTRLLKSLKTRVQSTLTIKLLNDSSFKDLGSLLTELDEANLNYKLILCNNLSWF